MARKKAYMADWYGSDELLKELEKAGGNIEAAIQEAIAESFKPVVKDLQHFTGTQHKASGNTQKSFVEDYGKWKNNKLNVQVGYAIKRVKEEDDSRMVEGLGEAAIFLQVGTPKMAPYFFVTSSYHDHELEIMKAQQEALEKTVERMLANLPNKGK